MSNARDYLLWRGDIPFSVSPLNEVDIFLLSQLSTPDFTGILQDDPISLAQTAAQYFAVHTEDVSNLGVLQSVHVLPMLREMAQCERFAGIKMKSYINIVDDNRTEQFAAVTVEIPDGTTVISFRGTDDSIIGWKEDFNIAILDETPAQKDAVQYVEAVSKESNGPILLCGHSKGGNLSVYAAVNSAGEIKQRIKAVYSFDGPGFKKSFLESEDYLKVKARIKTIVSQHSTVGVLLNLAGEEIIVRSNVAGPMAHDGFNWEVLCTEFVKENALSTASKAFGEAWDRTIEALSEDEFKEFTDQLFDTLLSTGATTIAEFIKLGPKTHLEVLKSLRSDKQVGEVKAEFLEQLLKLPVTERNISLQTLKKHTFHKIK